MFNLKMKKMKQFFMIPIFVIATACFSQEKSIFQDEHGTTQALMVDGHFKSLSSEIIQEVYKIKPALGQFLHLATDASRFYYLTDVSQLSEAKKNEFYQRLFEAKITFQAGHGLPEGYLWIILPKSESSSEDRLRVITDIFNSVNN